MQGLILFAAELSAFMFMIVGIGGAVEYVSDLWQGNAELPKILRKKKNPRRVAARRGEVGRKIRRTKYEYIEIIPDFGRSVKGLRVRRVWR
ncbi:MAG: hypothetical protein IJF49_08310 [Clostridia bacterium]|nr:hypothetical protein [Clostridia bacterium]